MSIDDESKHLTTRSRRGLKMYKENPFLAEAANTAKTGVKRLTNKSNTRMMIVSEHGEILAPAGFHEVVEVEKTQFVKLYINGVRAFQGLTSAGTKVFEIIYRAVMAKPGTDRLNLHFNTIDQDITPISRATYDRGMKELLEKKFIAESMVPGLYFLNIDYLFNGNRLAFIREFRLKGTTDALDVEHQPVETKALGSGASTPEDDHEKTE